MEGEPGNRDGISFFRFNEAVLIMTLSKVMNLLLISLMNMDTSLNITAFLGSSSFVLLIQLLMILQTERLYTTDVVALSHILNNGYEYQRPLSQRWVRSRSLGDSLLSTEGDQHRRQRRAMVPSIMTSVWEHN